MRITMLSRTDYAGSGYKIVEAVSRHTDYNIALFTTHRESKYNHPQGIYVTKENHQAIQQRIDESDIVHVKGDWPAKDGYLGFTIMHRPTVQTVGGGLFRRKGPGGGTDLHRYPPYAYKAKLNTAFTPDLCYPDYSDIWTPHPIDSHRQENIWRQRERPVLMHMPSNRLKKDTSFIMDVLREVERQIPCDVQLIQGVPFSEAVELKKKATIFFDQFRVGFYGNSAIEAMQYGIPTACYISEDAIWQAKGRIGGCPVISTAKDKDAWVSLIINTLQSDMGELSKKTKLWCDGLHSYLAIARQWRNLYNLIA